MPAQCCINRWNQLMANDPDMPVFTLLGKDLLALETVDFWLDKATKRGVNLAKIASVMEHRNAIAKFYKEHPERCQIPD